AGHAGARRARARSAAESRLWVLRSGPGRHPGADRRIALARQPAANTALRRGGIRRPRLSASYFRPVAQRRIPVSSSSGRQIEDVPDRVVLVDAAGVDVVGEARMDGRFVCRYVPSIVSWATASPPCSALRSLDRSETGISGYQAFRILEWCKECARSRSSSRVSRRSFSRPPHTPPRRDFRTNLI